MAEKLNMHTDPSGLLASLQAATDGRPYLGDPAVIERMLRHFASEVLTRYDEVGHGVLTPNDAASADHSACLTLAGILCGKDEAYAPVREWTGKPLADHLRQRMDRDLQPDDDDVQLVAQALAVLVHRLYDVLRHGSEGAPESALMEETEAAVRSMALALVGVVGND